MTLKEFLKLDYHGKMTATMEGVCIGGRNTEQHKVLLYQRNAFYIEVFYNKTYHFISDMIGFDSTDKLEPYLAKIKISL